MFKDYSGDSVQTQSSACTTLANSLMLTVFAVVFKSRAVTSWGRSDELVHHQRHVCHPLIRREESQSSEPSQWFSPGFAQVAADSYIQPFYFFFLLFFFWHNQSAKRGRVIVCFVANTSQTINKALIHRSEIISCSPKPIGHINTSIKALGYELNITLPRAGAKVMERSEECHDRAISAC